jgi:hypothetical protein
MKTNINKLDNSEKKRILEMHKKQGHTVNEQPDSKFDTRPAPLKPSTPKPLPPRPNRIGIVDDETGGTNPVLENPLYQNFYNDIMGVGVDILSKSTNSIKIDGPTGVWTLSKSST